MLVLVLVLARRSASALGWARLMPFGSASGSGYAGERLSASALAPQSESESARLLAPRAPSASRSASGLWPGPAVRGPARRPRTPQGSCLHCSRAAARPACARAGSSQPTIPTAR
ncbi:hypothetical protein ACFPRL_08160 [Pseudoclavibacter helvolus]